MTEWQEKQFNEQKRQCKCRRDEDGNKVSICKSCREFNGSVELDGEVAQDWITCNINA